MAEPQIEATFYDWCAGKCPRHDADRKFRLCIKLCMENSENYRQWWKERKGNRLYDIISGSLIKTTSELPKLKVQQVPDRSRTSTSITLGRGGGTKVLGHTHHDNG